MDIDTADRSWDMNILEMYLQFKEKNNAVLELCEVLHRRQNHYYARPTSQNVGMKVNKYLGGSTSETIP